MNKQILFLKNIIKIIYVTLIIISFSSIDKNSNLKANHLVHEFKPLRQMETKKLILFSNTFQPFMIEILYQEISNNNHHQYHQ
jgi:hypothetical protein